MQKNMQFLKDLRIYCLKNMKFFQMISFYGLIVIFVTSLVKDSLAQPYRGGVSSPQKCSNRLENALEHMRRRSAQVKSSRSFTPQSPYAIYHSLYGAQDDSEADDFYHPSTDREYYAKNINRSYRQLSRLDFDTSYANPSFQQANPPYQQRQPHKLQVARVDVEDLKVRIPSRTSNRWVEIDKCRFSSENSTLDTRLIFPDLTLSGKVVLQPTGGKCNMILRLRHAGIEFRTIPIGFEKINSEESRRIGAASVRTDSHFAEPGFISVFAHGCEGPTGIKLRQNSKRRYSLVGENNPELANKGHLTSEVIFDIRSEGYIPPNMRDHDLDWSDTPDSQELYDPNADNFYRRQFRYKRSASPPAYTRQSRSTLQTDRINDEMNFNDDILNLSHDNLDDLIRPDARAFAEIFAANGGGGASNGYAGNQDDVNDALTTELEKLFSMGVRGLLTTYMQRALQPAIKETLMENMGYTLSYG